MLNVDGGREGHRYTSRCQIRRETGQQMCGLFSNGTGLLGIDLSGHCGSSLQPFDSLFEATNSRGLDYSNELLAKMANSYLLFWLAVVTTYCMFFLSTLWRYWPMVDTTCCPVFLKCTMERNVLGHA